MSDLTEMDFRKDIQIDQENLDKEWLRQSDLLYVYGEALTEAKEYSRQCDQQTKVIRSNLILRAKRGDAEEELGTKKPTESVCEAYYRTHPDHVQAVIELTQARKEEDLMQQAVYAIQSRKCSLEYLVKLCLAEYFSGPIEPHDLSQYDYDDFPNAASIFLKKASERRKKTRKSGQRMAEKAPVARKRRT